MSMTGMSRRDRAVLAAVGVVALYAIAALLFFMGRQEAWTKARKAYVRETEKLEKENRLIAKTAFWRKREEESRTRMPMVGEDESTLTRWQRLHGSLAEKHSIAVKNEVPAKEEDHGGVWELPIEVSYEASLVRLLEFLHDLESVEGAMFDVRKLTIAPSSKNPGFLQGTYTLTCAYMKGSSK